MKKFIGKKTAIPAALLALCLLFTGCNEETSSTGSSNAVVSDGTSSAADNSSASGASSDISGNASDSTDVSENNSSAGTDSDTPAVSDGGSDVSGNASDSTDVSENNSSAGTDSDTPAVSDGGFKIDGTKLIDANGNEFIMRGINHAHAWYKNELDTALSAIAATGANCVRVVCANGQIWAKTNETDLENIINKCEENKLIAIVEVHDTTYGANEGGNKADDSIECLQAAADYWIEMKDIVNAHADTVIVNIANEWHNGGWTKPDEWAEGYKTVIPKLREAGVKNTLMVDADGNGQYPISLFGSEEKGTPAYAPDVLAADPDGNTMFSIHMYENAGADEQTVKSNIDQTIAQNVCFCIGEFGQARGAKRQKEIDEATIMSYCTEKGIGYIGWSWKGNGGSDIVLDIALEWDGSSLSDDWGEVLINGENGIKATSKICSVFE